MRIIADLHLHSRYSRACSKHLSIESLEAAARLKGIDLLGTGDFQHPEWLVELTRELREDGTGILRSASGFPFLLTTELSLIYKDQGRGRKIHVLIWAPDFTCARRIQQLLLSWGRIDYDGRPIFGVSCRTLVASLRDIDERIEIIPAHAWTPWFGILGKKGGYDSLEDAFGDQLAHIHAIETGISSDPEMNRRISDLDGLQLVSFSDAHSSNPWRLGREATIFELDELTYGGILEAVRTGTGLVGTIEAPPAYGKYHNDGHRACSVSLAPEQSEATGGICPSCGKPLITGVEHRVFELSDRTAGVPDREVAQMLPLHELIGIDTGTGLTSKRVAALFDALVPALGSEFDVLLRVAIERIADATNDELASLIEACRQGRISIEPGYDGIYGTVSMPEA